MGASSMEDLSAPDHSDTDSTDGLPWGQPHMEDSFGKMQISDQRKDKVVDFFICQC